MPPRSKLCVFVTHEEPTPGDRLSLSSTFATEFAPDALYVAFASSHATRLLNGNVASVVTYSSVREVIRQLRRMPPATMSVSVGCNGFVAAHPQMMLVSTPSTVLEDVRANARSPATDVCVRLSADCAAAECLTLMRALLQTGTKDVMVGGRCPPDGWHAQIGDSRIWKRAVH